jgi:pSer/pThr/pTyr-binding forkhead associated (FHA) protein
VERLAQAPKPATAVELKSQLEAERTGLPFLLYRSEDGEQRLVRLPENGGAIWIGRREAVDVSLSWDKEVSGLHAQLDVVGVDCTLVDDGLSRNGSYVNGERVQGRRMLHDRDVLRFGTTAILYRAPAEGPDGSTVVASDLLTRAQLSDAQRRVLVSLCRPFKDSAELATPATNQQIAEELFLSVEAVKAHLRALFAKFGIEDLPQNAKRLTLAQSALQIGLITSRDL